MALIEQPKAAMRLARAIASDISLYNQDKIIKGIQEDNLFDVLSAELDEGLTLYQSRVSPGLLDDTNFYYRAVVDIILKSKAHVETSIW